MVRWNCDSKDDTEKQYSRGGAVGDKFMFKYYEKPMGNEYCIINKYAMSYNCKRASLTQEINRILSNTHQSTQQEVKEKHVNESCNKLERSGYTLSQQMEI